jgi:hypothetical protein
MKIGVETGVVNWLVGRGVYELVDGEKPLYRILEVTRKLKAGEHRSGNSRRGSNDCF